MNLLTLFLPLAIDIVRMYIKSSDTTKDDQILNVVQDGCRYLAPKENNNLSPEISKKIQKTQFRGGN